MKFNDIRNDRMFNADYCGDYIDDLRNGKYKYHDKEDGEHIWGVAVLQIGYLDIELNLLNKSSKNGVELNETYPCYFVCVKGNEEWISAGYIDHIFPVGVDFNRDDWKEKLEIDMFKKLVAISKMYNLSFDKPNFNGPDEENKIFNLFNN